MLNDVAEGDESVRSNPMYFLQCLTVIEKSMQFLYNLEKVVSESDFGLLIFGRLYIGHKHYFLLIAPPGFFLSYTTDI